MGRVFGAGRQMAALIITLTIMGITTAATAAETPKVVVTIKPIHALVLAIMQDVGTPVLLVDTAASPHTFSLKPSHAQAINAADVFIRVSDELEPFTRKIVQTLPATVELVTLVEVKGVEMLPRRSGATFTTGAKQEASPHSHDDADHDHGHDDHVGHDHGPLDGHIWLDPKNTKAIVAAISETLAKRYPEAAARLRANAAALTQEVDALEKTIERDLAAVKARPFVVFHDSTQYFEKRFGLSALGAITVSADVQPSAKRLIDIRRQIRDLDAVCVFAEPGFQPKLLTAVVEDTTAHGGVLDVEGQLLQPGAALYFDLMRGLAHSFATCLRAPD